MKTALQTPLLLLDCALVGALVGCATEGAVPSEAETPSVSIAVTESPSDGFEDEIDAILAGRIPAARPAVPAPRPEIAPAEMMEIPFYY